MKNPKSGISNIPWLVSAGLGGALVCVMALGPLNPSAGPVGPTAKTLGEVEPRIAINATNTPGAPGSVYVISAPGSYYLTAGFTVPSGKSGISVTASHVTIDLNGCTVTGSGGSILGVDATGVVNTVVHSGSVVSIGETGVELAGQESLARDLRVGNCGIRGILLGDRSAARDCVVFNNASVGISAGNASVIEGCTSYGNGTGFWFGGASLLRDCLANGNSADGFVEQGGFGGCELMRCTATYCGSGSGIIVYSNGSVTDCMATNNPLSGFSPTGPGSVFRRCTAISNTQNGFNLNGLTNIVLEECTARNNPGAGAYVNHRSTVRRCTFDGNGVGLAVVFSGNIIEGCTAHSNTTGYSIGFAGNKLARNTASGNTSNNWSVAAGNTCYVVSATVGSAFSGSSGGTATTVTDPDANYSY